MMPNSINCQALANWSILALSTRHHDGKTPVQLRCGTPWCWVVCERAGSHIGFEPFSNSLVGALTPPSGPTARDHWLDQPQARCGARAACGDAICQVPNRNNLLAEHHHSITSSARASSDGGTVSPSVLAVLRLTTNSIFVGCKTGISTGFSPLRILAT